MLVSDHDPGRPASSAATYDDCGYFDVEEHYRSQGYVEVRDCCSPCWLTPEGYMRWQEAERSNRMAEQAELEGTPAEEFAAMKDQGGAAHARKMVRRGAAWKVKHGLREPVVLLNTKREWDHQGRHVRPHMTMHVRGGWQLRLDDDGRPVPEETDWVADAESAPVRKEVALVDIAKPAKPRKHRKKGKLLISSQGPQKF